MYLCVGTGEKKGDCILKKIMIFSGTTEGRALVKFLQAYSVQLYVSVATEYGKTCMGEAKNMKILTGRKNREEIYHFLQEHHVDLVIDATHPFAKVVTENIKEATKQAEVDYIRCLRDTGPTMDLADEFLICVESVQQAVEYLCRTEGNILISTGSKELEAYCRIPDYKTRCYARVLSTIQAVGESVHAGFEGRHLLAMQGPFSVEMNVAALHHVDAAYFVTKESGAAGGFTEKWEAAKSAGVKLVVITRPEEDGKSFAEVRELLTRFLES